MSRTFFPFSFLVPLLFAPLLLWTSLVVFVVSHISFLRLRLKKNPHLTTRFCLFSFSKKTFETSRYGVELIGAKLPSIDKAEDRELFKEAMKDIGLNTPTSGTATTMEEALAVHQMIGKFPLIIRPAFTLGGTGGGIAYNMDEFQEIVAAGISASLTDQVLIEQSLLGWKEYELEVMRVRMKKKFFFSRGCREVEVEKVFERRC